MTLDHPVMDAAGEAARAVFIWDNAEHDTRDYSLKRRVFIMESALDLGIPIYEGDTYVVLSSLVDADDTLYLAKTVSPYVRDIVSDLRDTHAVTLVEGPSLAHVPNDTDMGRFFRFWNKAKKSAMTHSQPQDQNA